MAATGRIDELRKRYDENERRFFAPLANEYRKAGDVEQAIALCRLHLAEAPSNLSGQIVFGQALFDAGNLDESRGAFEIAIGLDPENLIALRHLGDIARLQSDISRARDWYRRVLDADRRNEEVLALVAELDAEQGSAIPEEEESPNLAPPTFAMRTPTPVATPAVSFEAPAASVDAPTVEIDAVPPPPRAPTPAFEIVVDEPAPSAQVEEHPPSAGMEEPLPSAEADEPDDAGEATLIVPPMPRIFDEAAAAEPAPAAESLLDLEPTSFTPPADPAPAHSILDPLDDFQSVDATPAAVEADPPSVDEPAPLLEPMAEAATRLESTPDTSFGFDIDLGAAAGLPVASAEPSPIDDEISLDLPTSEPEHEMETLTAPVAEPTAGISETIELLDLDMPMSDAPEPETAPEPAVVADQPVSESHELELIDTIDLGEPIADDVVEAPALSFDTEPSPQEFAPSDPVLAAAEMLPPEFDRPITPPRSSTPVMGAFDVVEEAPAQIETTVDDAVEVIEQQHVTGLSYEDTSAPVEPHDDAPIYSMPTPVLAPAAVPVPTPVEPTLVAPALEPTPVVPSPTVEPFATETMAELYARQGLRQEAIGIYRQLIQARPGDANLKQRLAELETDGHVAPAATARAFFASLSSRRATPRFVPVAPAAAEPPAGAEPVAGTLDMLFGQASVGTHDEAAARALADAFGTESPDGGTGVLFDPNAGGGGRRSP